MPAMMFLPGVRLGQLLVTEDLLGGIGLGFGLHLCDHVSDEALDLDENVLRVAATAQQILCSTVHHHRQLVDLVFVITPHAE